MCEYVAQADYMFNINNGIDVGQEGFHLHAHEMGGRKMRTS
jgi:diadenosine tetraphosphate (Ap4A) HIT family hydrolase